MSAKADLIRAEVAHHFSGRTAQDRVAIPAEDRYTDALLRGLPQEAIMCSDGCGNPLLYTHIQPGQTVVDLGSGAGLDLLLAAARTGPEGKVIGVDMTASMVRLARENVRRAGFEHIELHEGVIEELPVASNSVDWVISNCVINLSPEKDRVFREIHRILKPGGRMVISDTVVGDVPSWMKELAARFNPVVRVLLSSDVYVETARGAGLEDVEILDSTVFTDDRLREMLIVEAGRFQRVGAGRASRAFALLERVLLTPLAIVSQRALSGQVSSIKVSARKKAA